jgi:hypothetical protein
MTLQWQSMKVKRKGICNHLECQLEAVLNRTRKGIQACNKIDKTLPWCKNLKTPMRTWTLIFKQYSLQIKLCKHNSSSNNLITTTEISLIHLKLIQCISYLITKNSNKDLISWSLLLAVVHLFSNPSTYKFYGSV